MTNQSAVNHSTDQPTEPTKPITQEENQQTNQPANEKITDLPTDQHHPSTIPQASRRFISSRIHLRVPRHNLRLGVLRLEPHQVFQGGGEVPGDAVPGDGDGRGPLEHERGREDRLACVRVPLAEPAWLLFVLLLLLLFFVVVVFVVVFVVVVVVVVFVVVFVVVVGGGGGGVGVNVVVVVGVAVDNGLYVLRQWLWSWSLSLLLLLLLPALQVLLLLLVANIGIDLHLRTPQRDYLSDMPIDHLQFLSPAAP